MNKKSFVLLVVLMATVTGAAMSQSVNTCRDIVLPMMNYNEEEYAKYPQDKINWYCSFSRAAFFETDSLPADAVVYDISVLKTNRDGQHITDDFVVNLSTLSYYAYNFDEFRFQHYDSILYFRTPSSAHRYLGVRPYADCMRQANAEHNQ